MSLRSVRISRQFIEMAVFAAMAMLCASCGYDRHKDIVCPSQVMRTVTVVFNWDHHPDADPEGMTLYFFPRSSDGRIWRFDIAGREGGTIEIPAGSYRLLAFNNDSRPIEFCNTTSYTDFSATTSLLTGYPSELHAMKMPEPLYAATVPDLDITLCGVRYNPGNGQPVKECGKSIVRCSPEPRFCRYNIIVEDVENISRVTSASGLLCGMAAEVSLAGGQLGDPPSAIPFRLSHPSGNSLTSSLCAFGSLGQKHTLILDATLDNGTRLQASHDVTDQILNSPDPRNVTIVVRGLKVPPPDKPVGGDDIIDVGVEGWTVIIVDISSDLRCLIR